MKNHLFIIIVSIFFLGSCEDSSNESAKVTSIGSSEVESEVNEFQGGYPTEEAAATDDFEKQVEDYIRKFPYQDTHNYAMSYTQGDPAKFNTWVLGSEPTLVKAGEDKVVRMNNDTFYKIAFVVLENGPVVLGSSDPAKDRFNSFQLMDNRNANYRNVIYPNGKYTLYHGEKPEQIQGEAIEVPSNPLRRHCPRGSEGQEQSQGPRSSRDGV